MNTLARELSKFSELSVLLIPINSGPKDLIDPNCQVVEINRSWRGSLSNTIKSLFRFQRVIREYSPDVVVLNCDLPEFFYSITPSSAKVVIVDHNTKSWKTRPFLGKIVWLSLCFRTYAVVRVSERIKVKVPNPKNNLVIYNPIPNEIYQTPSEVMLDQKVRLAFVGRLSQQKDPEFFCEIATNSGLPSIIIGDGLLASPLMMKYPELGWVGQSSNPWKLLNRRDLFILTSLYEGDGLVLVEALLNRVPVLVRDTEDSRAFNLPEQNYFQGSSDAGRKIQDYVDGKIDLTMPEDFLNTLLQERSAESIAREWVSLLLTAN
ncbi:GT4_GT28_WabH-like domain containing protein [Candidatus Nanopelagicaceae bacterium]